MNRDVGDGWVAGACVVKALERTWRDVIAHFTVLKHAVHKHTVACDLLAGTVLAD